MKEDITILTSFLSNIIRYFVFAGIPFLILYIWFPNTFSKNKIQGKLAKKKDIIREIFHSIQTSLVIAGVIVLFLNTPLFEFTLVYKDLNSYSYWWIPISIFLALVLHDSYFYWIHRAIHHPKLFRKVHLLHHQSVNPSPWASYSFSILEALLEALVAPLILVLIPMHPVAIFSFALTAFAINVYGHLGYEIAPKWFRHSFLFQILTTSTYHNMHHSRFYGNFGLYFRFWDRLLGTENPSYVKEYDKIQKRRFSGGQKKLKLKKSAATGLFFLFFCIGTTTAQESILGMWKDENKGVTIEVFEENDLVFGKLIGADDEMDDKKIKSQDEIIFMRDFEKTEDGNFCCGTIYQPRLKTEFTGILVLKNDDELEIKVEFRGRKRTRSWRRL